jgi:hypothetical protein
VLPALRIIGLCMLAAIAYGVVHDQVTVRVCVEYFSVTHPHLINTNSPTVLALAWGVVATWWVGLGLGIILALASRVGRWPTLDVRDLLSSVLILLGVMAAFATLAGIAGYQLSSQGKAMIPIEVADAIPVAMHHRWMAASYAHNASYDVGFVGGIVLSVLAILARRRRRTLASFA